MTTTDIQLTLIFIVLCCIAGAIIGQAKGRTNAGAMLGFWLGPIGILLAAGVLQSADEIAATAARIAARREAMRDAAEKRGTLADER